MKHFGPEGGSVINISSVVERQPAGRCRWSTRRTKSAVDAITRVLAEELGAAEDPRQLDQRRAASETEGAHIAGIIGSDFEKQIVARPPLGRIGQPDDIAPAVVFLASARLAAG